MIIKKLFATGLMLSLVACQSLPTTSTDPQQVKAAIAKSALESEAALKPPRLELPSEVEAEMLPELGSQNVAPIANERRFDINARDVEATTFFTSLVQGTPLSVAVHPDVTGSISLQLKQVTLPETMDLVSEMYGYDIRRTGRVLHIYPAGMRVEVLPMNYLLMERSGQSSTMISSGGESDSDTDSSDSDSDSGNLSSSSHSTQIDTSTSTDFWTELETTLLALIDSNKGDGRSVVVSPQAGLVTVRAFPSEIRIIKDYLEQAEEQLQRQVILEAKIIEVELSEAYQQGIDWTSDGFISSASTLTNDIVSNIGGGGTLILGGGSFELAISLLSTQGDVNVLSSPRVTASNNQKAVIKVGNDEYFVTDVSSDTESDDDDGSSSTSVEVDLTAFFSGIALDVTPQINGDDEVLLHVHPSVTDVEEQDKEISVTSGSNTVFLSLPLANSDTREADTVIKARSGEVVVIGGLMSTSHEELISKTPFVGDLPWIGELFTNRSVATQKTELIILLKPTVVERNSWRKQIETSRSLLDEWYPESR